MSMRSLIQIHRRKQIAIQSPNEEERGKTSKARRLPMGEPTPAHFRHFQQSRQQLLATCPIPKKHVFPSCWADHAPHYKYIISTLIQNLILKTLNNTHLRTHISLIHHS